MFLETVQQSPTALVLAILEQNLPAGLRVLRQAQIKHASWCVHFRIIGESHAITVSYQDDVVFHEVLACVDVSPQDCTHYQPFHALQDHDYKQAIIPQRPYSVQVIFAPQPVWNTPETSDQMIEFAFPNVGTLTPVTRIHWRMDDHTLTWWTLHTYPNAGDVTYVHSRSQVTLLDASDSKGQLKRV